MTSDQAISVRIEGRGVRAFVVIRAGAEPSRASPSSLKAQATAAGVVIDAAVEQKLAKIAADFQARPRDIDAVFAEAVPAVDGVDGSIEWARGFDPQAEQTAAHAVGDEKVDHYAGHTYVRVKCGEVVATMRHPTEGTHGRSVLGTVLKARSGKSCPIRIDKAFSVDARGQVIAQIDGVLQLHQHDLTITQFLQVPGAVDFTTGNIDFPGSVDIRDGVRDRFTVRTTADLTIGGLVESATIVCGRDFVCRSGVAGKNHGTLIVGRNAEASFLDHLRAQVGGNLTIRSEIMNCDLVVGGSLICEEGAIIGGNVSITGSALIGAIGSAGYSPTVIHLGEVPLLSAQLRKLMLLIKQLAPQLAALKATCASYDRAATLTAFEREHLTKLNRQIAEIQDKIEVCEAKRAEIEQSIEGKRCVSVRVAKAVYPKVRLQVGGREVQFEKTLKGPLKLGWDENHELTYRIADGPIRLMSDVARVINVAA